MAYSRLDYALATRSLPGDHPHAISIKLPAPIRSTLTRKPSFFTKLKAKISHRDLRGEIYDDDAVSLDSSLYSQDVDANMDGARGRRSALALCDGDDQLMTEAMKKHEEQKALFRAPSKHAPSALDADDTSRRQGTHGLTQGNIDVFDIEPSPSKPRICTEMASWTQYPSHTRADRCGSAGRADAMSAIDFGDPSRLRVEVVTPTTDKPPDMSSIRRQPTGSSKRSKRRRGLVKSTSQGLERVGRYYSNLFATAGFRGNNRRTSVSASTGNLQHPELEMLAPAATMDSHQPVYDHLKKVDQDLGMLSSAFRIPSFSKLGHHHDKGTGREDDEPNVGPDGEETTTVTPTPASNTPTRDPARKIERNMSGTPFRKLSTFFLVESKTHKSKAASIGSGAGEIAIPPEEDEPPSGPVQFDGAATAADTETIDTLDAFEGAERKSG